MASRLIESNLGATKSLTCKVHGYIGLVQISYETILKFEEKKLIFFFSGDFADSTKRVHWLAASQSTSFNNQRYGEQKKTFNLKQK